MSDLISRSALWKTFDKAHLFNDGNPRHIAQQIVEAAPSVDAVEVVRCKDCKHYDAEPRWCKRHSHFIDERGCACHPWESNDWLMFDEDDFCSYGERKNHV